MYFYKTLTSLLIVFIIQTISTSQVWAIKKRLQSTHAQRLSRLTKNPLESADFLNDGWLHDEALSVLEKSNQNDSEVLWRKARSIINQGENLPKEQGLEYYQRGDCMFYVVSSATILGLVELLLRYY